MGNVRRDFLPREQILGVIMKQTQDTSEDTDSLFRQLVFQAIDD